MELTGRRATGTHTRSLADICGGRWRFGVPSGRTAGCQPRVMLNTSERMLRGGVDALESGATPCTEARSSARVCWQDADVSGCVSSDGVAIGLSASMSE
jgi:hypothetical protein